MNSFTAFVKKEILESMRSYKLFIILVVFLLIGIMGPLTAKMMPDIMASFMPKGMKIVIPTPTVIDSWTQFFKNVSQMGIVILIIIFSGLVSNEFSKGTLINILTKGLKRHTVLIAKYVVASIIWTCAYLVCFGISYYYTNTLFVNEGIKNLLLASTGLWIFGEFLIAALILGGVLIKSNFGGMLFTFGLVAIMMILGIIPDIQKFNPLSLASSNMSLILGQLEVSSFITTIVTSVVIIILFLVSSIVVFNKKSI